MPRELATVIWFGVDDSSTSPRVPVYASSTVVPEAYAGRGTQDGVRFDIFDFDTKKAFWIQNLVSNFAYSRWEDCYPMIRKKVDEVHDAFETQIEQVDSAALNLYNEKGASMAVAYVTRFSVEAGADLQTQWTSFFGQLFTRFRDFSTIRPSENSRGFTIDSPGLSDDGKRRIVRETGTRYLVPSDKKITFTATRGGQPAEGLAKAY